MVNKAAPFHFSGLKIEGTYHLVVLGGANIGGVFRGGRGAPFRRAAQFTELQVLCHR
jgi:hypothetical protein